MVGPSVRRAAAALGLAVLALAVAGAGPGGVAEFSGTGAEQSRQRFAFHVELAAHSSLGLPREDIDISGGVWQKNIIDIGGWKLGIWRRQGPHHMAVIRRGMALHVRSLEQRMPSLVPAGFDGYVVIDYEAWWALWERTSNQPSSAPSDALDTDFKDDWRDFIRERRPHLVDGLSAADAERVYEATYEAHVRNFMLTTLYTCKRLRPRAKWGFYNYPQVLVNSDLTPPGVKGYGDLTHEASLLNDQNQWLYDAADFVAPRIYPPFEVLPETPEGGFKPGQIPVRGHEEWLSSMVREAVRLARGKPVIPIHSAVYYSSQDISLQPVTYFQHREVFRILAENGAAGVIVWHSVATAEELDEYWRMWAEILKPAGEDASREING